MLEKRGNAQSADFSEKRRPVWAKNKSCIESNAKYMYHTINEQVHDMHKNPLALFST